MPAFAACWVQLLAGTQSRWKRTWTFLYQDVHCPRPEDGGGSEPLPVSACNVLPIKASACPRPGFSSPLGIKCKVTKDWLGFSTGTTPHLPSNSSRRLTRLRYQEGTQGGGGEGCPPRPGLAPPPALVSNPEVDPKEHSVLSAVSQLSAKTTQSYDIQNQVLCGAELFTCVMAPAAAGI